MIVRLALKKTVFLQLVAKTNIERIINCFRKFSSNNKKILFFFLNTRLEKTQLFTNSN